VIPLWPFHTGGGRIKDLKAPQVAQATMTALQKGGRTPYSLRLLYRTLEVDPFHPEALLILSELYRGKSKTGPPTGDEIFSGIIIEYAMDRKHPLSPEHRRIFDKARLEIMTEWGFARPRASEMDVDHLGYMAFINGTMGKVKSVANGFKLALNKVGVQAGIIDPAKGVPNRAYQEWLSSDASTLRL
jgi:hypothetical protein